MIMRLTMCRMAGYEWEKFPNIRRFESSMATRANDTVSAAYRKVNEIVIMVVKVGTGNLSVLKTFKPL